MSVGERVCVYVCVCVCVCVCGCVCGCVCVDVSVDVSERVCQVVQEVCLRTVVAVLDDLGVPTVRLVALHYVLGECKLRLAIDLDLEGSESASK